MSELLTVDQVSPGLAHPKESAVPRPVASPPEKGRGLRPQRTHPTRVLWAYAIAVPLIHGLALLALLPFFFSRTGVALAITGHYVFGMLGITLCYHRLLTHRGFACPRWLEYTLATLGVCCLQDTPARWVAIHRKHHQHSDEQPDPHSPLVTFLWGHFGWLMIENREMSGVDFYDKYSRDLLRQRFYLSFERGWMWLWIYVAHAAVFFLVGLAVMWPISGDSWRGVQFGGSLLVWGVFVRTVLVWHVTWAVNSVTHVWGYRNYNTSDNSRNNWLVGLLAHGEGWHNNHHAQPRPARHGHRWWEMDCTWWIVLILEKVGLAWDVVRPTLDPNTRTSQASMPVK